MSSERVGAADPLEQRVATPQRSARTTALLPVGAMAVTVLLWASAFVAIRHLGPTVSPGALTLGRLTVGSLVLGAVLLTRREAWPRRADWPRLIAIGVLWFAVYNVALNAAEHRVDAGTAAMLVNIGPVLLALLAGMRLGEGFPRPLIVGSAIGFGGVAVIGVATSTGTRTARFLPHLPTVLLDMLRTSGDSLAYPWGFITERAVPTPVRREECASDVKEP